MSIVAKLLGQAESFLKQGNLEAAISLCVEANAVEPDNEDVWFMRGAIAALCGRLSEAVEAYEICVKLQPKSGRNIEAFASALVKTGRLAESIIQYERLLKLSPNRADLWAVLSGVRFRVGELKGAEVAARRSTELDINLPEPLINLALIHQQKSDVKAAEEYCLRAIAIDKKFPEAHFTLGVIHLMRGRHDEAILCFKRVLEIEPGNAKALINMGNVFREKLQVARAGEFYRQAAKVAPESAAAHSNLGIVLKDQGRMEEALSAFRRSLELEPDNHLARSNLLFCLCFKVEQDLDEVFEEHQEFERRHAYPLRPRVENHSVDADPEKPLRIGLLSPDLRVHPGGHFFLPIVEGLARKRHQLFCYYNFRAADHWTKKFRSAAHQFHQIDQWPDEQVAERIRDDRIDILIEGAGHMSGNRLLVVARKPAPVQISTALYPNTTGMSAIDYRLLDERVALLDAQRYHSENIIRLPETHFCYRPLDIDVEPAMRLPARENGYVSFGSFNNAIKLNDLTVQYWARILRAVPFSRLVLKWLEFDRPESAGILDRFAEHDIAPERIVRFGHSPDPYTPYRGLDICLDPIRASGGTTTCDALWMGVPVVTYAGETQFGRTGLMHLTNIGLPQLVANSLESFAQIAIDLATDLDRLEQIRSGLRERMRRSPIMDEARYTDFLDRELRRIWRDWCGRMLRQTEDSRR